MLTVLLDVDGTLVDSSAPILQALNAALCESKLAAVADDELRKHIGHHLRQILESLLKSRDADLSMLPQLVSAYREAYQPLSVELAATYPGVEEMLEALDGTVRMGVVTSKPVFYAEPILVRLGFAERMELIEGPDLSLDIEAKSVTLERALRRMGVSDGSTAVMVGDRRHDIEAGHACRTATVGVTCNRVSQPIASRRS